jgi:hypothetical protein
VSRSTWGANPESPLAFTYRTITFYDQPFQVVQLTTGLITLREGRNLLQLNPTTPIMQRFRAITHDRFRLFPVRSPLLGKSLTCFLLLRVLRCFSSPRLPHIPMYSVYDVTVLPVTGFPIQKSPDQCLFGSSPRLIAACHVFHRRLAPRHPPSALSSLATKKLS